MSIDTQTLRATRTRVVPALAHAQLGAVLAADDGSLFVNTAAQGITRIDAQTLTPDPHTLAPTEQVLSLQADRSGRALYLLAADGLFVLAPDGRVLACWSAPGGAAGMAPPPSPGRGTYNCAC